MAGRPVRRVGVVTAALAARLAEALAREGSRLTDVATGEDASGDSLIARATALAHSLRRLELLPHEPVHVRIGNRPEDLAAMLGVWLAEGVVVPVHVSAASHTLQNLRAATSARFVVDRGVIETIGIGPPPPREMLEGAALIIFTSGTTGVPKGVVIGHSALAGKLDVLSTMLTFRTDDVVLLPLQLTFIFGIWVALLTLCSRARLMLVQRFDHDIISAMLANDVSVLATVPSVLRTVFARSVPQTRRLRMVFTGGESLGPMLSRHLSAAWPAARIYDLYGSTETGSCDFCHIAGSVGGADSIGGPTDHVRFRIVDARGEDMAEGLPGELLIRTPFGMTGYLDNPTLTNASFLDGYFRTGDLAKLLPDHSVALVGRLKEIVSKGGNKIAPQEIDNLLCSHPGVAASLTAGIPDSRLGEALYSAIVLKPGHAVTAETLKIWMAERIERFKIPETMRIVDALPMGPTGKASRAALKETFSP